jgi:hypothetical protein
LYGKSSRALTFENLCQTGAAVSGGEGYGSEEGLGGGEGGVFVGGSIVGEEGVGDGEAHILKSTLDSDFT